MTHKTSARLSRARAASRDMATAAKAGSIGSARPSPSWPARSARSVKARTRSREPRISSSAALPSARMLWLWRASHWSSVPAQRPPIPSTKATRPARESVTCSRLAPSSAATRGRTASTCAVVTPKAAARLAATLPPSTSGRMSCMDRCPRPSPRFRLRAGWRPRVRICCLQSSERTAAQRKQKAPTERRRTIGAAVQAGVLDHYRCKPPAASLVPQKPAAPVDGRHVPCVDGSALARTFFASQVWSEQPCVRPLYAVHMTAGHNALRGSGPGQNPALDSAVARVGCPDLRIDRICITCCSSFQPSHHAG